MWNSACNHVILDSENLSVFIIYGLRADYINHSLRHKDKMGACVRRVYCRIALLCACERGREDRRQEDEHDLEYSLTRQFQLIFDGNNWECCLGGTVLYLIFISVLDFIDGGFAEPIFAINSKLLMGFNSLPIM